MKKILVLKDKMIEIKIYEEYLEFVCEEKEFIAAFKHISEVYINKQINISLDKTLKIAKKVPLFLTDHNGYIVAKVETDV